MQLRRARPEDARGIEEVHRRAVMDADEPAYDDETLDAWAASVTDESIEQVADDIRSEDSSLFVFENAEGSIVGFSCAIPEGGEIRAVYVDPELSGRGLGSALLRQAEWAAAQEGRDELELHASHNAIPFYEAHGYERLERDTVELSDGTEMSCVRMSKEVEQGMDETW